MIHVYIENNFSQVLALSETHGRTERPCDLPLVDGYSSWSSDRGGSDKGGGGLTLLYKNSIITHEYRPNVPSGYEYLDNERQWLLISSGSDRIAFLSIYIACQNSRNNTFLSWNEDLFFLVSQEAASLRLQGFVIVAMGDFNSRVGAIPGLEGNTEDVNMNSPMFFNFLKENNLFIVNTLPFSRGLFTRFFDVSGRTISKSLLDYALIDNARVGDVTSFVIDEFSRYAAGSDHALLEMEVKFGHRPRIQWQFQEAIHYNIPENGDASVYKNTLDASIKSMSLEAFSQLSPSDMLPHISENINNTAMGVFGVKSFKHRRKGRRLPLSLRNVIHEKKTLLVRLANSADPEEQKDLSFKIGILKDTISERISNFRLQKRTKIRSKLLLEDPTRRKFWRFLRKQAASAGRITAMRDPSGAIVFGQQEIEDTILHHFTDVFGGSPVPVFDGPYSNNLDTCDRGGERKFPSTHFESSVCSPFTLLELGSILDKLPKNKASGIDNISNELLSASGPWFRKYLLVFLNKILEDGIVPEGLNSGKCIILHKVVDSFHFKFFFFVCHSFSVWRYHGGLKL